MSYEESDAWEEAGIEAMYAQVLADPTVKQQFYEELNDEIVKDFTDGRLRSFFEEEPHVAAPAVTALEDARRFRSSGDYTAAFAFASIAADVGLTSTLLKPIVHGLVHAEGSAALVAKLAIKHSDENLVKMLLDLLAAHGGVDPRLFKRDGSQHTLWEEARVVKVKRNRVVHQAERASQEDAELAVQVATAILEDLFPALVEHVGLHVHDAVVCLIVHR